MRKGLLAGCGGCGVGTLALGLFFLSCMGMNVPADLLFNTAFGWVLYLHRVLPQVRIDGSGIWTAAFCLTAFALGLHWFLCWFVRQAPPAADPTATPWPARRTAVILGLIVLMFVAGLAAAGIGHQMGWLLTSPEPFVVDGMEESSDRYQSQNNLRQMALAMFNYQESNKTLPPAAIWDRQGRPLLSWRVLILPYIEQETLHQEFHLDEPWDSPHNLRFLPRMPKIYALPSRTKRFKPHRTPYRVFTGEGTAFEGKSGLRWPDDFPDGTSTTILVVEAAELVPWTKPAELPFAPHRPLPPLGLSSRHSIQAALADGSVRVIRRPVSEETLRAAITRNGDEVLGKDW